MLDVYTVAFFGHRYINNYHIIEKSLEEHIYKLIEEKEYLEFLVGKNGDFDRCVSSVVSRVKKNYRDDNSSLVLVLPYLTSDFLKNEKYYKDYYNSIEISYASSQVYPKAAIQTRNREMVDRANLIICYIENQKGGAYQTIQHAKNQRKNIINLAEINYKS